MVSGCVLIRAEKGRYADVVRRLRQLKEAKHVFAVLGRYDVVADIEAPSVEVLGRTILRMNRLAGVVFTESLVEVVSKGK
jgi:uncharacterized protein with GYD domain